MTIGRETDLKELTANMVGFGSGKSQRVIIDYDKDYSWFMKDGRAVIKWEKKVSGGRNEPLDLRNYNTAAAEILQPDFDVLEKKVKAGINYMKRSPAKPGAKRRTGTVNRGVQI